MGGWPTSPAPWWNSRPNSWSRGQSVYEPFIVQVALALPGAAGPPIACTFRLKVYAQVGQRRFTVARTEHRAKLIKKKKIQAQGVILYPRCAHRAPARLPLRSWVTPTSKTAGDVLSREAPTPAVADGGQEGPLAAGDKGPNVPPGQLPPYTAPPPAQSAANLDAVQTVGPALGARSRPPWLPRLLPASPEPSPDSAPSQEARPPLSPQDRAPSPGRAEASLPLTPKAGPAPASQMQPGPQTGASPGASRTGGGEHAGWEGEWPRGRDTEGQAAIQTPQES